MMDNGEGSPVPHEETPEDAPASTGTKKKLIDEIETTLHRTARNSVNINPPDSEWPIIFTPLTGTQDEIPAEINIAECPRGHSENPNLKWIISVVRGNAPDLQEEYAISKIPDGWDVEYHERMAMQPDEDPFKKHEEMYRAREQSVQQARELNIASLPEGKAKRLTKLLKTATGHYFE